MKGQIVNKSLHQIFLLQTSGNGAFRKSKVRQFWLENSLIPPQVPKDLV